MRRVYFIFKRADFRMEAGVHAASLYSYGFNEVKMKHRGAVTSNLESIPSSSGLFGRLAGKLSGFLIGETWLWGEAWAGAKLAKAQSAAVIACHDAITLPLLCLRFLGIGPGQVIGITVGLNERMRHYTFFGRLLTRIIAPQAAALVHFSPEESVFLRSIGFSETQLRFFPFTVDSALFSYEPESGEEKYDFVSVGRDPNRDFKSVIELARQSPSYRGLIITSKSIAGTLPALPENLSLKTDLSLEETLSELKSAKCVVLPTRNNSYSAATTTAVLSMAKGRPVLISRIGTIADAYGFISGENCLLAEPGANLATAVKTLLENKSYRSSIAQMGRKLVEAKLSQSVFAEKISALTRSQETK